MPQDLGDGAGTVRAMSFATAMMMSLALLLPAKGGVMTRLDTDLSETSAPAPQPGRAAAEPSPASPVTGASVSPVLWLFVPQGAQQVRIEQRMTIRISPQGEARQRSLFDDLPDQAIGPRFVERKIGQCIRVARISGVQTDVGNRLLLFMSDRRIISARLERACKARDFYSGFYLAKSEDGKLCVTRDTLQSRSGANCRLTSFHELIAIDD